ncbi:hypothetical protein G4177_07240 [Corallococcus sp. ZKHCc1 1396]|uniref:Lipoprotein n=1 Tax=Corallococcus soli TaxID=2710757 RepID=A0ABR9PJ92_9BACT|nr:hypothetical protein [Corallococcus soli]MBE4747971.1 hypothetical protein [Corallococcus soli]
MRMDVLVCGLLLSLMVGCGSRNKGPSRRALQEARQDWSRQGANYRGTEGFQEARWGMTSSEVQDLFPEATVLTSNALVLRTEVAKLPAVVTFGFLGDRLVATEVAFPEVADLKGSLRLLRDLLTQKFGPPVRVRDSNAAQRKAGTYRTAAEVTLALGQPVSTDRGWPRDIPEPAPEEAPEARPEEDAVGEARVAGKRHKLWSQWKTVESHVMLSSSKSPGAASFVIEYESARYEADLNRARAVAREGMLKDL